MKPSSINTLSEAENISSESLMTDIGFRPLKDQVKILTEAGKKLINYRCQSSVYEIDGEPVDHNIFHNRYYDKIDLAELEKWHNNKLDQIRKISLTKPKKGVADKQQPSENPPQEPSREAPQTPN